MRLKNIPLLPAILLSSIFPSAAASSSSTVQLHHRFLPLPSISEPEWLPLGSISLDGELTASKLNLSSPSAAHGEAVDDGKGWYQVGVDRDGGSEWIVASTRACMLAFSAPSISLHLSGPHITFISLHTSNSRCSNISIDSTIRLPSENAQWNVEIHRPIRIHSPDISPAAPPADPTTGLPKQPEPEKSFLQKYWLPMVGIALFLAGQLGGAGPAAAAGAGSGCAGEGSG